MTMMSIYVTLSRLSGYDSQITEHKRTTKAGQGDAFDPPPPPPKITEKFHRPWDADQSILSGIL